MRDYGIVSPRFWIGDTGKGLRGDPAAQVLALYLMTSPHSTMTGVFHCPVLYMAHETGLDMEGATKALQSLLQRGFCEYDEGSETVFVLRMAAYQIGKSLKPGDNRVAGLRKEVARMPEGPMKSRFLDEYGEPFRLVERLQGESENKAPCKPLPSQEQEQELKQDIPASPKRVSARKTQIPEGFGVSGRVREFAGRHGYRNLEERLEHFLGYCRANGKTYVDWDQAFENAIRDDWAKLNSRVRPVHAEPAWAGAK